MIKKHSFEGNDYNGYAMCAIVSHLKDYRLAYYINKNLGIQLKKYDDLSVIGKKQTYSWYYFKDNSTDLIYYLVANYHPDGRLIPLQKVDYYIFLKNIVEKQQIEDLLVRLRKVPDIILIFEHDMKKVKKIDELHESIEFHELRQISRPEPKKLK